MVTGQLLVSVIATLAVSVGAHPGHDIAAEALERREFISQSVNLQAKCGKHLEARGFNERAIQRRQALAEAFRTKRGLPLQPIIQKRNFTEVLDTNHHSNLTGITFETDPDSLFADQTSCLLQEEVTEGPYYVTGEYVRRNITEDQQGVPIVLDMQVIDVNTCEPFPNAHVEFWHCNATGVYGGIIANGNGNSADTSNINSTWLRGIQPTDNDGVVQVESIYPGHYTGRTNHIHILTHSNGTVLPNNTFVGGTNSHVGQLFFDQNLTSLVEQTTPYSQNNQTLTPNADDSIMAAEANTTDPVVEYVYAGSQIEDGLIMWITVGINSTLNKNVSAAATYGADGGHTLSGAGGMPPPPTTTA